MLEVLSVGVAAMTVASCMSALQATDGSFGGVPPGGTFTVLGDDMAAVLAASAARDIPCDRFALSLVGANIPGDLYAVEGCGQRVTYSLSSYLEADGRSQRLFLVARLPLVAGASE